MDGDWWGWLMGDSRWDGEMGAENFPQHAVLDFISAVVRATQRSSTCQPPSHRLSPINHPHQSPSINTPSPFLSLSLSQSQDDFFLPWLFSGLLTCMRARSADSSRDDAPRLPQSTNPPHAHRIQYLLSPLFCRQTSAKITPRLK